MYLSNKLDALLLEPTSSVILKVFILTTLLKVRFPAKARDLPLVQNIEAGSEALQWAQEVLSLGVKSPGHEAENSLKSITKV
jgi:hypothetical protein